MRSVAAVAITPMRPVRLSSAAGFTAGSSPTTGTGNRARSSSSAAPEAVLQATTTSLAPRATSVSAAASESRRISSRLRPP